MAPHTKLAADAHIGDGTVVGEGSMIAGGAVIGANVKIGKSVTLAGVASMGPGTEIGEGSSLGMAGSSLASGDASSDEDAAPQGDDSVATVGEEEAQEEEAQFYRPDPGSPFARKGNADMDMKLDGHNHWPVYLPLVSLSLVSLSHENRITNETVSQTVSFVTACNIMLCEYVSLAHTES